MSGCSDSSQATETVTQPTFASCSLRVESTPPPFDGGFVFQPELRWSVVAEFETVEDQLAFSQGITSALTSDAQLLAIARRVMVQEAGEPDGKTAIIDMNDGATMSDACLLGEALVAHLGPTVDIYILDAR